ncbi:uncharacterized protein LOC131688202 [Topomyia yanbarensis]|uniref:uncharacterized protein LOC131688202 n=1 Tax=Topomyia yanbarensis TaxID=2498891 RepID=UPI00273B7336|nr:uncharacterized protein LOC131688202 [Topomyia yanbarensis]
MDVGQGWALQTRRPIKFDPKAIGVAYSPERGVPERPVVDSGTIIAKSPSKVPLSTLNQLRGSTETSESPINRSDRYRRARQKVASLVASDPATQQRTCSIATPTTDHRSRPSQQHPVVVAIATAADRFPLRPSVRRPALYRPTLTHKNSVLNEKIGRKGSSSSSRKRPRLDGDCDQSSPNVNEGTKDIDSNVKIPLTTRQLFGALSITDYDVVVFTETWLNDNILNTELADEYAIYRCDRNSSTSRHSRGGGVLIGIKKNNRRNIVAIDGAESLEQIAARVTCGTVSIVICVIYLPPNSELALYEQHAACVDKLLNHIDDRTRVVVLGDYNLPLLRWSFDDEIGCFIPNNASSEHELLLVETMIASGLQQVNYLTNDNGRLLDLAFLSSASDFEILEPPVPLMKLDRHHHPFVLIIETLYGSPVIDDVDVWYDFNQCDYDELNARISNINWIEILSLGTLDEAVDRFYRELDLIFQQHVPLRRRKRSCTNKRLWWNDEMRNLRNRLRKARKRFFRKRGKDDKSFVRDLERQFQSLNASCFRSYVLRLESNMKDEPKQFWAYLQNKTSTRGFPENVNYRDRTSTTPAESANLFSSYFQSVLSNNPHPLSESYLSSLPTFSLNLPVTSFTEREVYTNLRGVDGSKGPASDGIQPCFVKKCSSSLAVPISMLFNRSLGESIFPPSERRL